MNRKRTTIAADIAAEALFRCDRTCAVCNERGRTVQIHHIDEDPSNHDMENLAVLCLECHNDTQMRGGFGRRLSADVVRTYRDDWIERVSSRRSAADRIILERWVGETARPTPPSVEKIEYSEERADSIRAYVESLPALRLELRAKAQIGWDTGQTAAMVNSSYEYVDALQAILITLAGFYATGTFGHDPERYFSELIASRFQWHHHHAEPYGPGTGGTIVNVVVSGNVVSDVERMVEEMAMSLVGYDDAFDWRRWPVSWNA